MVAYWREQSRPLSKAQSFKDTKLNKITPAHIAGYQNERNDVGMAPKTINGEVSVLRQLLKHARCVVGIESRPRSSGVEREQQDERGAGKGDMH